MIIKEGQVFYCPVCGVEVKVTKGGDCTSPLSCCDAAMIELKATRKR